MPATASHAHVAANIAFRYVEAQDVAVGDHVATVEGGLPGLWFTVTRVRAGFSGEVRLSYVATAVGGAPVTCVHSAPETRALFIAR